MLQKFIKKVFDFKQTYVMKTFEKIIRVRKIINIYT